MSPTNPILIKEADSSIPMSIDGILAEDIWAEVPFYNEFYVTSPETFEPAEHDTRVRMFYTNNGLYVSAEMQQESNTLVERLSAPDQGFLTRDYFIFNLDTSGEGRYGYWFQLNLGDSRADGTIQAERQYSTNWDGAWYGATSRTDSGWVAEFFIPWSIVSMPRTDGPRKMGFYASRKIAYSDSRYGWPALTFSSSKFMSIFQPLIFENVKPRQQLSFFPYVASTHRRVIERDQQNAGVDLFWRPSTNFQVTATANPDFGTVEPDSVVINLSAIETFFPEKRLFFQEGQEIFVATDRASSWSSNTPVILLHTRRIGQRPIYPELPDDATFDPFDFQQPSDITGATKLTGQVGSIRYGFLAAAEEDSRFLGTRNDGSSVSVDQSGRNFGVARVLYESTNNDYRGIGFLTTRMVHPDHEASTHGIDGHYLNESGLIHIDGQLLMSDVIDQDNGFGGFIDLRIRPNPNLSHELVFESFDDKLDLNDLGYLARNDQNAFRYRFRHRREEIGAFRQIYTRVSVGKGWNSSGEVIQEYATVSVEFTSKNLSRFRVEAKYRPDTIDDRNSFGNGSFREQGENEIGLRFQSDSSKRFYYTIRGSWESDYDNGNNFSTSNSLVLRPSDRFSSYINIGYGDRDGWLLFHGNRRFIVYETNSWSSQVGIDFFINAKQQIRFDLQWRGIKAFASKPLVLPETSIDLVADSTPLLPSDDFAISRLNLQLRYHWALAPMSDLFFVFTRNASLPNPIHMEFADTFRETLRNASSEQIAFKLRRHLGTR